MANNYCRYCFELPVVDPGQVEFFEDWLEEPDYEEDTDADPDEWYQERGGVELIELDNTILLLAEETGIPENAARLAAEWQKRFNIKETVEFQYAEYCGAMRPGEFGGGGYVIKDGVAISYDERYKACVERVAYLEQRLQEERERRVALESPRLFT